MFDKEAVESVDIIEVFCAPKDDAFVHSQKHLLTLEDIDGLDSESELMKVLETWN